MIRTFRSSAERVVGRTNFYTNVPGAGPPPTKIICPVHGLPGRSFQPSLFLGGELVHGTRWARGPCPGHWCRNTASEPLLIAIFLREHVHEVQLLVGTRGRTVHCARPAGRPAAAPPALPDPSPLGTLRNPLPLK